jgi:hypothetical protein
MASSMGIGNFNIEPIESSTSALNLHNRPSVDTSLLTGNDIFITPTGGLSQNGPFEFVLTGESSFHKVLNLSRLFGEFNLVDYNSGELIKKEDNVSFVNNIGHSWISSVEVFLNDRSCFDQSTQTYAYKSFIEHCLSFSPNKKNTDFCGSYWMDDDENFDKYDFDQSNVLKSRRKMLEGDDFNKGFFCVNLNIDAFKGPIYLFPGINIKIRIHKMKDEFFLMSNGAVEIFLIKDLKLRMRLVQTNEKFINQAKAIGNGNEPPAFLPFSQTKLRTFLVVKDISSFVWNNCIRGTIPQQIIIAFIDHEAYVGNYKKNPFAFENFGISRINLKINGNPYPSTPYSPNFESGDFLDLYEDFLRGIGVSDSNETVGISKQEYRKHKMFTIFGKY